MRFSFNQISEHNFVYLNSTPPSLIYTKYNTLMIYSGQNKYEL